MKVEDLMAQLAEMHPGAYQLEGLTHWTSIADKALREFEGASLRVAFDEVTKGWKQGYAPKPADFVEAAKRARAALRAPRDLPEVRDTPTTRRPEFAAAAAYVADWTKRPLEECRRIVQNWLAMARDDLDLIASMLEQHQRYRIADLLVWIQTRIQIRMEARAGSAPTMSEVGTFIRANQRRLVDDWLRDNSAEAENFLGQFPDEAPAPERVRFGEWTAMAASSNDRQRAHRRLIELLRNRAHDAAMLLALGKTGVVKIEPDDLQRIAEQVAALRAHSAPVRPQLSPAAFAMSEPAREQVPWDFDEAEQPQQRETAP